MAKSAKIKSRRGSKSGSGNQRPGAAVSSDDDIHILTYVESPPEEMGADEDQFLSGDGSRSFMQRLRGVVPKIDAVSPETLQANLSRFLRAMEKSLSDAPVQLAEYRLDEIEIAVEVSAEGEVSLLGNGGKVGGKGTLTLKLKHFPEKN